MTPSDYQDKDASHDRRICRSISRIDADSKDEKERTDLSPYFGALKDSPLLDKIELQKIKKEIAEVEQQLNVLSTRKEELLTKKAKLEEIMATADDGKSPKKPKQNIKAPKNIN